MKQPVEVYDIDLYDEYKNSKEIILEVFITDKCNYNCYYCINLKIFNVRQNRELNLEQLYKFILFLNKTTKKHIRVILIGGEPTVHSNFLNFIKQTATIRNDGILTIESFTNLSQTENFYIETFKKNIFYKISFHYLNELRSENFLKKIISFKNNYFDNIQQIFIMLEYNNFDKCLKIFDILYQIYGKKVICCLIDDSDKDKLIKNRQINYTGNQLDEYQKRCDINKLYNEFFIQYNDNSTELKSLYDIKNDQKYNFKLWKCNAGKDFFSVDFNGNIFPCSRLTNKLGNLNNFYGIKFKQHMCSSSICCNYELLKIRIFK